MSPPEATSRWRGYVAALIAYGLWGLVPLYWQLFKGLSASYIFSWRVIWSVSFLALLIFPSYKLRLQLREALRWKTLSWVLLGAVGIGMNWFIYIWAVGAGHVLETSLGYYLNPLVNVAFGVIFFKDKPNAAQRIAIGIASSAIAFQIVSLGYPPWIALSLAVTFGFYGVVKKLSKVDGRVALFIETFAMLLPSAIILLQDVEATEVALAQLSFWQQVAIALSGVVTALPLLAFARAAKELTLTVLGFFQYLAPSLQFLCAIFFFKEPLSSTNLIVFATIWAALAIAAFDNFARYRKLRWG